MEVERPLPLPSRVLAWRRVGAGRYKEDAMVVYVFRGVVLWDFKKEAHDLGTEAHDGCHD